MRRRVAVAFGIIAAGLLSGCNQPAVSLKPPAFQDSANTLRDWDVVADKIADGVAAQRSATAGHPGYRFLTGPFFVHSTAPRSTFLHEVADRLKDRLMQRGFFVARSPSGATVINLKVDVIRWGPRDKPPGGLGTLAGAFGVAGILVGSDSSPIGTWGAARAGAWGVGATGVVSDLVTAMTPTMNSEVAWSASIVSDDVVLLSMREPLYVRDHDLPLYYGGTEIAEISEPAYALQPRRIRLDP